MKRLIAVTGTLIVLLSAFSVQARSLQPFSYILAGNLTEAMNIDQDSYLNKMEIFGGRVLVKQIKRELTLKLQHAPACSAGMACIEVLLVHDISLKITSESTDGCGSYTYTATRDHRPADGVLETLSVTDNTNNKCLTLIALPATRVTYATSYYDRINGKVVSSHSTFEAEKLEGRVLPTSDLEKVLPALK